MGGEYFLGFTQQMDVTGKSLPMVWVLKTEGQPMKSCFDHKLSR